jgi:pimeloyl-ACP methyl ester carboxylesterase
MNFRVDVGSALITGLGLAFALGTAACSERFVPDPLGQGGSGSSASSTSGGEGTGGAVVHTEADTAAMRVAIDAYIDQRFEAPPEATDQLLALLDKGQFTLDETEAILRGARSAYPDPTMKLGQIGTFDVTCYHVDYSSIAYFKVPLTYDPAKPTPLIIVGHGGDSSMSKDFARSTALDYIKAYNQLGKTMNAILVAPATERGWSPIGDSLILSSISKIQRDYNVDPERIYVTGQSMGGHLSWRTALTYGDHYAAFSPMSGGYPEWATNGTLRNLWTTVGFNTWGEIEPYDLDKTNVILHDWLTTHSFAWTGTQVPGEHPIATGAFPAIADLFNQNPRKMYRADTWYSSGGTMQYTGNWVVAGWPKHTINLARPLMYNLRHWIRVTPRPDFMGSLTFSGRVLPDNHLDIVAENVRQMKVMLHPMMGLDLTKPVSITVNGKEMFNDVVATDRKQMLELIREFDDRGRLFEGFVDLTITTDSAVPDPGMVK